MINLFTITSGRQMKLGNRKKETNWLHSSTKNTTYYNIYKTDFQQLYRDRNLFYAWSMLAREVTRQNNAPKSAYLRNS